MSTPATPPIVWGPGFELGIEDIDLQHHYFANLINRMSKDFANHAEPALRLALLAELNAYARFHFLSEENLMLRTSYPGLAAHRALHLELIDELSGRQGKLILKNVAVEAGEVLDFLVQWFLGHTSHEDRLFADHMQSRSAS